MKWYVHVFVGGTYSGAYEHDSEEAAKIDGSQRAASLGRLSCLYFVSTRRELPPPEDWGSVPKEFTHVSQ